MTSDEVPGSGEPASPASKRAKSEPVQLLIVLAGIILGQVILYGPALTGRKILLPLDILASQNVYLPRTPENAMIQPRNMVLSDLVYLFEPERRFAAREIRAGRIPLWAPYHFAGAPFVWPKFSPFLMLQSLVSSPVVLAWVQLLAAVVAGLGAYFFCRRVLMVSRWPATFAAWCYPLTGFFVLSQGFTLAWPVYWLPWILLAVDGTVRRTHRGAPIGLSVMTALVLTSGQLDVAGQVLLVSGGYALWCWLDEHPGQWFQKQARRAVLALVLGWGLGVFLAAPYVLPVLEYGQSGTRVARRSAGLEERLPVGLAALPQIVLPKIYGSTERGSFPMFPKNQGNVQESSALAYTGLLATLFAAPLAFCSRRHRSINLFWVILSLFSLGWALNFFPIVRLLRLPGLNMMSHNRLVFAASFAILALSAVGFDRLWRKRVKWRAWFWLFPVLLLGLCFWSAYRVNVLPEPIKSEVGQALAKGDKVKWVGNMEELHKVQVNFSRAYLVVALLCSLALAGWLFLWRRNNWHYGPASFLGLLMVGDLIWFNFGQFSQCEPALYYPRIPVLEQLSKAPPGRVIGFLCLPALLATTHGLNDVRGFDPIVPARFVDLMNIAADSRSAVFDYALLQWLVPKAAPTPSGDIRLSPILDMLNVRYVIFRGAPIPSDHPYLQGQDYWVVLNPSALPRAFVPRAVEVVADDKARLQKLAAPTFDPRSIAYVESPIELPASCVGAAEIMSEIPLRITVNLRMETPGLVVLADLWDKGWHASLNGKPMTILRVNHAIRGVNVPAGPGTLEFRYKPSSFAWGLGLAGFAVVFLMVWVTMVSRRGRRFDGLCVKETSS